MTDHDTIATAPTGLAGPIQDGGRQFATRLARRRRRAPEPIEHVQSSPLRDHRTELALRMPRL